MAVPSIPNDWRYCPTGHRGSRASPWSAPWWLPGASGEIPGANRYSAGYSRWSAGNPVPTTRCHRPLHRVQHRGRLRSRPTGTGFALPDASRDVGYDSGIVWTGQPWWGRRLRQGLTSRASGRDGKPPHITGLLHNRHNHEVPAAGVLSHASYDPGALTRVQVISITAGRVQT